MNKHRYLTKTKIVVTIDEISENEDDDDDDKNDRTTSFCFECFYCFCDLVQRNIVSLFLPDQEEIIHRLIDLLITNIFFLFFLFASLAKHIIQQEKKRTNVFPPCRIR